MADRLASTENGQANKPRQSDAYPTQPGRQLQALLWNHPAREVLPNTPGMLTSLLSGEVECQIVSLAEVKCQPVCLAEVKCRLVCLAEVKYRLVSLLQ